MKVTIEIETTDKEVECANAILAQAIISLENNPSIMKEFGYSRTTIANAIKFREKLLKSFLK